MRGRNAIAVLLALAASALFVRLGIWQLHRLAERRAFNAQLVRRLGAAPAQLSGLPHDTAAAHYRRVQVTGMYDFGHEIVLTGRSSEGSPGVDLLTPLRASGSDTAILVDRGWVYSPDAATVDLSRWREAPGSSVVGYIEEFSSQGRAPRSPTDPRAWHRLDGPSLVRSFPYPIAPFYIVAIGQETRRDVPVRRGLPTLSEGPHQSYAIQWFTFAAIAIVGVGILLWHERQMRSTSL